MHILQPENLLLDPSGVLKVSDFGLSTFSPQVRVSIMFIIQVPDFYCLKPSLLVWHTKQVEKEMIYFFSA